MFGNKEIGVITFSYNSDELFNDVGILSAYMAKSINLAAVDEFSVSDDEKDLYNVCVKQALPNIYEAMLKISTGVEDAFNDSAKVLKNETDGLFRKAGTYVELSIEDNDAYNKNVLSIVEATLSTCLKYGILTEFYSIRLNADLYALAKEKFNNSLYQLKQRLFQLKKKTISSQLD